MTVELEGVLRGVKVLVVEDEFLVAALIENMLHTAGCIVTGPIPRLGEALDAVDRGTYDAAILDVNLAGDRIDPVARALSCRNIPFAFVTGYTISSLPSDYAERPHLRKPFRMTDLLSTVSDLVHPSRPKVG